MFKTRLGDLQPGDRVRMENAPAGRREAVLVGFMFRHPLYPHLSMVIWRLSDGSWSHDALLLTMGLEAAGLRVEASDNDRRLERLAWALSEDLWQSAFHLAEVGQPATGAGGRTGGKTAAQTRSVTGASGRARGRTAGSRRPK